ncbi:proprotein convertase P-domain-containing protein [Montanilutibacter psychrotolerans]|nr:proprotein convertase P-domain-containing protein [Lysobacter psychrotolerans]
MKPSLPLYSAVTLVTGALFACLPMQAIAAGPAIVANAAAPKPMKIADQRSVSLSLRAGGPGLVAQPMQVIRTADAAFIKVHFDHFSLPAGVTLEVSSPDRREVYRYSKQSLDRHTVDGALGQNGATSFSAMSIQGPVAVLRLVGTATEAWTARHGVTVSRYLEGYPERMIPELDNAGLLGDVTSKSVCGVQDARGAACYSSSEPAAFDRTRPVGRMLSGSGSLCTVWRVGPDNRLFTNNHCLSTSSAVAGSEFWFNYQASSCGGSVATPTKVTGNTMLATDASLDYTLFTVNNFSALAPFGWLGLDISTQAVGAKLYIAGHPAGRPKELSVVSDQNGGGYCQVDNANAEGGLDLGYYCDTEGGSSGSPVIARNSNKAIALHHFGGCLNSGAKIALIWPQVASHFGNVVPDGDNGGGNAPPAANFGAAVSGLSVAFTDSSTDSDGTIASRSWNFGDGTTSTATNPSKTYSAAGTYTVTLTVTDDDGATNTKSQSVSVGTVGNVLTKGVPVTGLSAAAGASLNYTMVVPTGASNLTFTMSGGTGDADMYVKFGSAPTDTVYDCRPYTGGNAETCTFAAPQAGTYHVRLKGYSAFSGVSLVGDYGTGGGGTQTYSNAADYTISDNATVDSPITVSGRTGTAPSNASVTVAIVHTYQGDLKVDLVAPDGSLYNLHNRTGGSADNINKTVTLNLSTEALNGTWKLRVNDNAGGDTGKIDSWSITF